MRNLCFGPLGNKKEEGEGREGGLARNRAFSLPGKQKTLWLFTAGHYGGWLIPNVLCLEAWSRVQASLLSGGVSHRCTVPPCFLWEQSYPYLHPHASYWSWRGFCPSLVKSLLFRQSSVVYFRCLFPSLFLLYFQFGFGRWYGQILLLCHHLSPSGCFLIFLLVRLLQLGLPVLCWIKVVKTDLPVLFPILRQTIAVFAYLVWCWMWICHIWPLLYWAMFLLLPLGWEFLS